MRCILCGNAGLLIIRDYIYKSTFFLHQFPGLKLLKCGSCGLLQVAHDDINRYDLNRYYLDFYRKKAGIAGNNSPLDNAWYGARAQALAELAREHFPNIKQKINVFEVGAGYGYNLLAVKNIFTGAVLFTDEVDQSIIYSGGIARAGLSENKYDILIMSHVLEHLVYPCGFMVSAIDNLNTGGIIIIEVPNEQPMYEGLLEYDFHEPHLSFFSADLLKYFIQYNFSDSVKIEVLSSAGPAMDARRTTLKKFFQSIRRAAPRPLLGIALDVKHFTSRIINKKKSYSFDFRSAPEDLSRIFLRIVLRKL